MVNLVNTIFAAISWRQVQTVVSTHSAFLIGRELLFIADMQLFITFYANEATVV